MKDIVTQLSTWTFHREIDEEKNESASITIHGKTEVGEHHMPFEIIVKERKDLGDVSGYICKPFGLEDEDDEGLLPIIVNIPNEKVIELFDDLVKAKKIGADREIAIFRGQRPDNEDGISWEWDMSKDIEIESWGYHLGFTD